MIPTIQRLVPMAFVADVQRSIDFYAHLGFTIHNTHADEISGELVWAWLTTGSAHLMIAKASEQVVPDQQAVLFYLYTESVEPVRNALLEAGLDPGPISMPFYAPKGEFRLTDPDGYVLMISHV